MNIALWVVASVLAVGFTAGGTVKLTGSHERYAAKLPGGLGLLLPGLLDIALVLVPVAASGLAL